MIGWKSWLADAPAQVTLRPMSKKAQHEPPADDWAGLAQNLFGINLDKPGVDDDLLDDDMFKVEIPPAAEPAAAKIADEVISFVEAELVQPAELQVDVKKPVVTKPKPTPPPKPVVAKTVVEDDPFGAGILEEVVAVTPTVDSSDEGFTLPEDFDEEGLTLASDFDDGLTLPPDHEDNGLTLSAEGDDEDEDEDDLTFSSESAASNEEALHDDEDNDRTDSPAKENDAVKGAGAERPHKRQPRRTREDAYWDMLENWEWEEIPDSDAPRSEGERPRSRGGDRDRGGRGGRSGGRGGDRGGRGGDRGGREERPRAAEQSRPAERPRRDEPRPAETPSTAPRNESSDSSSRPRRGDRPRDDRGPRPERRPERDDRRDEPRPAAVSQSPAASNIPEDFGFGIFEEQTSATPKPSASKPIVPTARAPRDEVVAQSSQAADKVLRDSKPAAGQSVSDELVWPDDNSNVRPTPMESMVETSVLPAADVAGESDRMVAASDVTPLDESEQRSRRPRRRRRRGGPNSERTAPPDGNEGTTFDLSEALSGEGESPDFIPSASGDDSAVSADSAGDESEAAKGDDLSSERRGSRRRRRRRRPGESAPSDSTPNVGAAVGAEGETIEPADEPEEHEEENVVLKPIAYSNVPSWEEAIRYLLEPHLVGRNLGPDDGDEGLASDPRGSGGAEPTTAPPPPPRRRRGGGGGGGRGRRP